MRAYVWFRNFTIILLCSFMICIFYFFFSKPNKNKKKMFRARSAIYRTKMPLADCSACFFISPFIESESYARLRSYALCTHHFVDTVPSIYASRTSHICVQQAAVQSSREETNKCAKCEMSNVCKELTITQE